MLFFYQTAHLPNPGQSLLPPLGLCYHLHFGWNSKFIHPIVGNLQIHPEQMLQEEITKTIIGHGFCKNTNE